MWLVFGGRGWIGQQLLDVLRERQIAFSAPDTRVDDTDAVRTLLHTLRPTRVICLTGRTHGDGCATIDYLERGRPQLVENVRDNLFAPVSLALLCQERNVHMTYLGTGCIFSSTDPASDAGFTESAQPNFFGSAYSIVKGFTDRLMHQLESHVLQLRIRMPINADMDSARNFLHKITTYEKICSVANSMTVLPDLLPVMVTLIERAATGTYNMTNPGVISHNEILDMYRDLVDPEFTYTNFSQEEQDRILAAGRSNNRLDTSRLEGEFLVLPIDLSIRRILRVVAMKKRSMTPWRPHTVLVTGGCGFIGSNFLRFLHAKDPSLTLLNIDRMTYCASLGNVDGVPVTSFPLDLQETEKVLDILTVYHVDTIVHFAAQSHVDHCFGDPLCFTQDNVCGTHALLEAAKRYGQLQRFLHVSTDEVYGETVTDRLFVENDALRPTTVYAATKAAAEMLVHSYMQSLSVPAMMVRGNNVFGPRQFPEKVIPRFIVALLKGEPCTVHGKGKTRRNFLFVEDMCSAVWTILQHGSIGEVYNVGADPAEERTVMDIVKTLVHMIHPASRVEDHVVFVEDRPQNDFTYRVDSSRLHALGWSPRTAFADGLKQTIAFFRASSS